MSSKREGMAVTFVLTVLSTGGITESLTRFFSLMRATPSVIICGTIGCVALILMLLILFLED